MARYFFDIHDGSSLPDDHGVECANLDAVRREAKKALPEIARDVLPLDGDSYTSTVRVRDEQHRTVYTAVLTFTGISTC